MLAKYAIAGLAGSMLAGVAFAQNRLRLQQSGHHRRACGASIPHHSRQLAVLECGLSVYNDNNESVGSINEILMDKSGDIKAVVIGVGGVLGVGEHLVAVPFDKVKFVNEPVAYTGTAGSTNKPTTSNTTTGAATTNTAPASTKSNTWYPDHAVYNATKDELKAMPEFKYSQ
jgi:hypothetical protein